MQKRLISVLVVVFMLATSLLSLTACGTNASQQSAAMTPVAVADKAGAVNYIFYGDVNADGDINMKDVLLIRRIIAGQKPTDVFVDEAAADANADGDVNMKDVLLLRQYVAKFPNVTLPTTGTQTVATTSTTASTTQPTGTTTRPTTASTTRINQEDPAINFIDGDGTLGVWWWHDVGYGSNLEKSYLDLLEKNQFTEIYFYTYSKLWSAAERAKLHDFVQRVLTRGMRVSILFDDIAVARGGSDAWNRTISGFVAYKQEFPGDDSFYGVHCDIEPSASTANLQAYVNNFIPKIRDARSKGIQVEVDLPCGWYSYGRDIVDNGITGIYEIIAANVDTMCLMSYSDDAIGIYGMSYYPLEAAKAAGTKIVFGIECGNSGEGDKVDFSGESKYEAYVELAILDKRLKVQELAIPYGYAIHHMKAYYNLRALPAGGF